MNEGRKFYWLKLKRDFFKRHDMKIIEGLEDGHEISLFYIKLLLESLDHNGELRYSETKPYSAGMLASVFNTDKNIVEKALETLKEFELIQILEDGTICMSELSNMIGFETEWARQKREWREKNGQKEDTNRTMSRQCPDNVLTLSDKSIEIRDKRLDIKERNSKERKFAKPTLEDVSKYCLERNNNIDPQKFFDYYESKGWVVGKTKMKDWKAAVRTWERNEKESPAQSKSHIGTDKKDWDNLWKWAEDEDRKRGNKE